MTGPMNYIDKTGQSFPVGRQNQQTNGKVYTQNDFTFEKILKEQLGGRENQQLQFSKHAAARVEQRGIELNQGVMDGLRQAVEKARDKGAKDVVVIGTQGAFIVNVPNNTVVTTMTPAEMRNNIFTNIDSAVIM